MRSIEVFTEDKEVFVNEDGQLVSIKSFDTEEEAEEFVTGIGEKVIAAINDAVTGKTAIDKLDDLQGMLESELGGKESNMAKWAFGVLDKARKEGKI